MENRMKKMTVYDCFKIKNLYIITMTFHTIDRLVITIK